MKCIICDNVMKKNINIKGLLICPKCSFMCADINISNSDIESLYTSKYFCGDEYTDYIADHKLHSKNFRQKLNKMQTVIGDLHEKKCFEIGSAYGFFLEQAKKYFDSCCGIDISKDATEFAVNNTKVNAVAGDFLNIPIEETSDVVCMWDTIEHLSEPKEFLKKAHSILSKNGYICITTGDIGSLNAKFRGHKWRQIHPPTHLQYFSKDTLSKLLNNCGFDVVNISYPGNEMSLRNIIYSILCLRMNRKSWYNKHQNSKLLDIHLTINLHDYIFVIAKKRDEK